VSRRHLTFACEGSTLVATLDEGTASTGLLIVSGGNELRSGPWGGQAQLAAHIAEAGYPVFRYDRRGVGDSEGPNGQFRSSATDVVAAIAAFRAACPLASRIVALGNCDAASALMLTQGAGCDALILSNPWTVEVTDVSTPPQALRGHYRQRLADSAALKRLLRGDVKFSALFASLLSAFKPSPLPTGLAHEMAEGISRFTGPITFLLAKRDRTAQTFLAAWKKGDPRIQLCEGASHSFVEPHAREWLVARVLEVLSA
jgi:exosortase A-associated hydrolase 1